MAILKIARMGHPVLAQRADDVPDPTAPAVRQLLSDMVETLEDIEGAGLAAPQVHVPLRIVIFKVDAGRTTDGADDTPLPLTALINPVIEPLSDERELGWEACLSLPGLIGAVPRFTDIRYTGLDHEGRPIERTATGFHARVVQHECDHLDGVLYPMQMTDFSNFGFAEEMRRRALQADGRSGGAPVSETDPEPAATPETAPETAEA